MGTGQLYDIGMKERQEVREEEEKRGKSIETELKGKERRTKMGREEEKVLNISKKTA